MFADLKLYGQTVRVYNAHLESYRFSLGQRRMMELETGFEGGNPQADSARVPDSQSVWKMVKTMIVTWRKQEEQLGQYLEHAGPDAPSSPRLLCADLNNGPTSYFYRKLTQHLHDTFRRRGGGTGRTFSKGGWLPMRIDYVLASPHFTVADHQVLHPPTALSDHYPVLAVLRLAPTSRD
jgi:endonuclease/exonuclease/phosphatase family metal-dependent hydrolase